MMLKNLQWEDRELCAFPCCWNTPAFIVYSCQPQTVGAFDVGLFKEFKQQLWFVEKRERCVNM